MKYFGTDGFRGEANVGLTVEHAYKIGRFVGWYYGANRGAKARVIVGKDTRRSSYMFEAALVSGLVASGADAYMLHVIPTPGVAHQTVEGCFDCGIMISASHNPFCDNGIKLVNSDGFKMDEDVLELIEDYIDGKSEVPLATGNHIGATVDYMQGRNRYIASLIASANFSLQGVKIGLDCANGSASSVAKPVFDALGADVRVINAAPDGFNINVDCGSTHIERLQRHVVEQGLDVGFAYDGDADRCLAVDERGRVVDGDQILYVCGVYLNKHGRLSGGTVVPTIASNFGLIKSLELAGLSAVTSGVGDRHVYAKMREGGYSLGGEQTGHTIFGDIERTGDGIMTSLRVMEVIRAERETLSQLTAPCKLLPQAQVAVRVADKDAALENMGVQADNLAGEYFITTGSGKFFRNVEPDPIHSIGIVEINDKGDSWRIVWGLEGGAKPTSEFPSHFMNHSVRKAATNGANRVIYHCHATNVIALTYILPLTDRDFSRALWQSATECPVVFPEGVGVCPWMVPGGADIAMATSELMKKYQAAIWAQHGLFVSGPDFDIAFGLAHTIEKSAEIYVKVLSMSGGLIRQTITDDDLRAIARDFGVTLNEEFLD